MHPFYGRPFGISLSFSHSNGSFYKTDLIVWIASKGFSMASDCFLGWLLNANEPSLKKRKWYSLCEVNEGYFIQIGLVMTQINETACYEVNL